MSLSIPRGYSYNSEKNTLTANIFFHPETGDYYTTDSVDGLFTYYSKLTEHDRLTVLNHYLTGVELAQKTGLNLSIKNPFDVAQKTARLHLTNDHIYKIQLSPDFPKISEDFIRLVKLYQTYCNKGATSLEVGVVLFYNPDKKELRFVLPTQTVRPAFWSWDMSPGKKAFFLDGEETSLEKLASEGWVKCGTSHSHNTMAASWSPVDISDQAGTKEDPKFAALHFLLGSFKNFQNPKVAPIFDIRISASINGVFHDLTSQIEGIIDTNSEIDFDSVSYDPSILSIVSETQYVNKYNWLPSAQPNKTTTQTFNYASAKTLNRPKLHDLTDGQLIVYLAEILDVFNSRNYDITRAVNSALILNGTPLVNSDEDEVFSWLY